MSSFRCKRLPCLVVRLLISSCPIGTNRTLYPFLHQNGRFAMKWGISAMKWGIFCDEMGHFCTLRPSSARLHAFYLHLTLFVCTALIFNALRRAGKSEQNLHTLCTACTPSSNRQIVTYGAKNGVG